MSGRHQISADGKHLIDGVAFGRPRLKTPRDRPPVDIPPLKRRRITYEDEEGDEEEPRLLLTEHGEDGRRRKRVRIHDRFDDASVDEYGDDEEDGDDDFSGEDTDGSAEGDEDSESDDIDDSDVQDELRDLQAENEWLQDERPARPEVLGETAAGPATQEKTRGLDLATLDKISALRAAFPKVSISACERALLRHDGDLQEAYYRLRSRYRPRLSFDEIALRFDHPPPPSSAGAPGYEDPRESDDSETQSVDSMVKHYDQHGFPSGSILAGTASTQMAETMRKSGHPVKPPVHTKFDDYKHTSDQTSSSGSEDDDYSDSHSETDSGPEVASSKPPNASAGARLSASSDVDSESESDCDCDSECESDSGSENDSEDESDSGSESGSESESGNESDSASIGDGPGDVGSASDSDDSMDGDIDDWSSSSDGSSSSDDESSDEDGHAKSRSTSDSSASPSESAESDDTSTSEDSVGDSASGRSTSPVAQKRAVPADLQTSGTRPKTIQSSVQGTSVHREEPEKIFPEQHSASKDAPRPVPPGQGKTATQKRNARRRAALKARKAAAQAQELPEPSQSAGVGSGAESAELRESIDVKKAALLRSLQFLGVPSQDAGSVESKHSADEPVRQQAQNRQSLSSPKGERAQSKEGQAEREQDSEAWRDKIIYRAVECCHDGVELSEPPFPFVQRWDPQQQRFSKEKTQRGGRSKRKQRNQAEYLDEESRSGAKRRKYAGYEADDVSHQSSRQQDDGTTYQDTVLNYDDEPQEASDRSEQAGSQTADGEDLPPLPPDLSTLPMLQPGQVTAGMVLTWKQLLLSKATSWQPQVADLTGVVVEVLEDNALRVRLAKRDRNLDRNEKVFDEEGNRVYDKFELPGMDEEGEEAGEEGYRTLELADMMEPRILQPAPCRASGLDRSDPSPEATREEGVGSTKGDIPTADDKEQEGEHTIGSGGADDSDAQPNCRGEEAPEASTSSQPADEISMTEDRRREISLLINDAGFRKDIDPSVTGNASLDLSSPSRQLEDMVQDAPAATSEASLAQCQTSPERQSQAKTNLDSQPILIEPFHGFSDATSEVHEEGRVAYPKLNLPVSETGSTRSGRQVDPDFSIELGDDTFHGLEDGEGASSPPRHHDRDEGHAASADDSGAESDSDCSDSSLPSLSDLWGGTASTKGSKSPSRSASAVRGRESTAGSHEESMRRHDSTDSRPAEDDRGRQQSVELAQKLVDKPIEKPAPKKTAQQKTTAAVNIKKERGSPRAATGDSLGNLAQPSRSARESKSPFVIPEGSQVVSLLDSSPEPEIEEHYADDSVDETYREPGMPTGSGWVKKSRTRRGVSVPASSAARETAPRRLASSQAQSQTQSQSRQSTDGRSNAALSSLMRAKRKVLGDTL